MNGDKPICNPLKQLLLLYRDKFTGWWLLDVCDCPEAAIAFAKKVARDLGYELNQ